MMPPCPQLRQVYDWVAAVWLGKSAKQGNSVSQFLVGARHGRGNGSLLSPRSCHSWVHTLILSAVFMPQGYELSP